MYKLYVVGIGPGAYEDMTIRASRCLDNSDVIIGYTVYVDLVKAYFPKKRYLTTPMKQEIERCHMAFQEAQKGNTVSMICSGDAGVYGMAGPILELSEQYPEVEVEVIPGVTAALSGAALLGAPLTHDFAVISLSDLLTPWDVIVKRIEMASKADFTMCIYNPSSKKRADYLEKACDIIGQYRSLDTVCGIAWHIGREGEKIQQLTLRELRGTQVDMFATVFIGNATTKNVKTGIVTPRGYHTK
ncbi:MAG: precorrin-3B C(17)-methyltransferase [Lachnospiraceae bacterium]|nr:precorrin-3B C(17)-methyltransferase [Lachnospiraceae bacterium]